MTEYLTEYLVIVGGICGAVVAWITVEHIRLRRYLRRLPENMARQLEWDETGGRDR